MKNKHANFSKELPGKKDRNLLARCPTKAKARKGISPLKRAQHSSHFHQGLALGLVPCSSVHLPTRCLLVQKHKEVSSCNPSARKSYKNEDGLTLEMSVGFFVIWITRQYSWKKDDEVMIMGILLSFLITEKALPLAIEYDVCCRLLVGTIYQVNKISIHC